MSFTAIPVSCCRRTRGSTALALVTRKMGEWGVRRRLFSTLNVRDASARRASVRHGVGLQGRADGEPLSHPHWLRFTDLGSQPSTGSCTPPLYVSATYDISGLGLQAI